MSLHRLAVLSGSVRFSAVPSDTTVQTLCDLHNFKLCKCRLVQFLKSKKGEVVTSCKSVPNFSLREWKCIEMKVTEEYCGVITQWRSDQAVANQVPSCLEFQFKLNSLAGTVVMNHMCVYTQFWLAQNLTSTGPFDRNCWIGWGVSVLEIRLLPFP